MTYSKEWLRVDELQRILHDPELSYKYEIWVKMLYGPALRVSEAINVQVRDIDLQNGCIDIWGGKGKDASEAQKAPCPAKNLKDIKRYCEHNKLGPRDYIMFSNKAPQVTRSHVYKVAKSLCGKAGIDKRIGTHTFRRSRAEHLLDSGVSIEYLRRYLRHKNIATTMQYLDISVSDVHRELAKIQDPIDTM